MAKYKRKRKKSYVLSYLALGLHMQQQVVDYIQDHSVLDGVGGDLQVMVDEGEGVHSPWRSRTVHSCSSSIAT